MPDMPLPTPSQMCGPACKDSLVWQLVYAHTFTGLYAAGMAAMEPEALSWEDVSRIAAQAREAAALAVHGMTEPVNISGPGLGYVDL